jgi:hypothetical protein
VKETPAPDARLAADAGNGPEYRFSAAGALTVRSEGVMLSISIVPLLFTFMIIVTCPPTTPVAGATKPAVREPPGISVAVRVMVNVGVPVNVMVGVYVSGCAVVLVSVGVAIAFVNVIVAVSNGVFVGEDPVVCVHVNVGEMTGVSVTVNVGETVRVLEEVGETV